MAAIDLANARQHALRHSLLPPEPTEEEKLQLKGRISALVAQTPPLLKEDWKQDKRKFVAAQHSLQRVSKRSAKMDLDHFPRKLTMAYYEQHLASHAVNTTFKQVSSP